MRARTLAPSFLPLLEAAVEGFFWNLPELSRRIRFDVLHGCETCPLEAHFQSREQPKVTRSEIRRVRWLSDDRNVFLGEELLHNKRCVARCVIVMQKPLSLPLVAPLPPNCNPMVILRSHQISCRTFPIISSVLDVKGPPLRWSSSNVSCPFLNRENQSQTADFFSAVSP